MKLKTRMPMKKHEIIFWSLKVPLDFFTVFFSFFIAREIRLITDLLPNIHLPIQAIDILPLFTFALLGSFLVIFMFATHSLYFIKITNSKIKEFLEIIRYSFYSFIFFSVIVYGGQWIIFDVEIPRLIILFTFIIATTLIILERIIINQFWYFLLKKWYIERKKLLLITNKSEIKEVLDDIRSSKIYKIIWYANSKSISLGKTKYIWGLENIQSLLESKKCDEVLYIDSDFSKKDLLKLWELSKIFWVRYRYITNSFDITKTNTTLSLINNIPVIEIKNTPLDNWWRIIKRVFDIFAGIIWVIVLSPVILITSLCIKIDDPKAPVIYKNRRIGQNWKIFNLYKFRYIKREYCVKDGYWIEDSKDKALLFENELIKKNSSRSGPLYKIKNDPRKTSIWNFIEKYYIDEIPQFFNIILWNMSLVWPRPHQPREVKKYSLEQRRLLTIKPWITWMAQVNGRDKNDFIKEAKLDIFYIENWSLLIDIKIILKTFSIVFHRK